ncbi:hypothetical protein C8Q75DRAFT_758594 [Abortiporus biennis]|nr:hypothetical protein C8Q75DRAFT_758594 [Abortiporus biennis]
MDPTAAKKPIHQKRSVQSSKHNIMHHSNQPLDSPAYDASEEDNDPLTDDGASAISVATSSASSRPLPRSNNMPNRANANIPAPIAPPPNKARHALASSLISSDEGVDSPTYDGDIESSTTAGPDRASSKHHYTSSIASTLSPSTPAAHLPADPVISTKLPELTARTHHGHEHKHSHGLHPHHHSVVPRPTPSHPSRPLEPPPASISAAAFNPANLTPADIQEYVQGVIAGPGIAVGVGEDKQWYKISEPPTSRPVRIYADGVYDLFHFGHALQLRQAKLSFPSVPPRHYQSPSTTPHLPSAATPPASSAGPLSSTPPASSSLSSLHQDSINSQSEFFSGNEWTPGVYLLVGVNSDEQCQEHKSKTVMTHAERCESVRHCRWVDEVVPDAPWVIDEAFLQKYKIDYVAHDEDPYGSAGHDDVYAYCKQQGKFLPTRRTPGISTSDLLARLVSGYRHRVWDKKLEKMGLRQLMAEGSDWDESRVGSRVPSTEPSRVGSPTGERSPTDDGKEKVDVGAGLEVRVEAPPS